MGDCESWLSDTIKNSSSNKCDFIRESKQHKLQYQTYEDQYKFVQLLGEDKDWKQLKPEKKQLEQLFTTYFNLFPSITLIKDIIYFIQIINFIEITTTTCIVNLFKLPVFS